MAFRLFLLFIVLPAVELALLIEVGRHIGFWSTLGILVATGAVGAMLAKQQGFSVFRRFNERLARGEMPGSELLDGVIVLVCGALLVTPGVLTDIVGILGLIPFTRSFLKRIIMSRIKRATARGTVGIHFSTFTGGRGHSENSDDREEIPPATPGGWR